MYSAVQNQNAVSAYFTSERILAFDFAYRQTSKLLFISGLGVSHNNVTNFTKYVPLT